MFPKCTKPVTKMLCRCLEKAPRKISEGTMHKPYSRAKTRIYASARLSIILCSRIHGTKTSFCFYLFSLHNSGLDTILQYPQKKVNENSRQKNLSHHMQSNLSKETTKKICALFLGLINHHYEQESHIQHVANAIIRWLPEPSANLRGCECSELQGDLLH